MLIRRREADQRLWDLTAATQPHRKPDSQRRVWEKTDRAGRIGERRRSPYEMCETDAQRIELIGSAISAAGDRWVKSHPRQMEWLAARNISPEEAVRRHRDWLAREMRNPFWRPAGK